MKKLKILFFTPSLHRTGSEIVLFNLINNSTDFFEMAIISRTKGELANELSLNVSVYFSSLLKPINGSWLIKAVNKIYRNISFPSHFFLKIHKIFQPDLWYINTIMMPEAVDCAIENKIPFIVHTHELEQMLEQLTEKEQNNLLLNPRLIIANSAASAKATIDFGSHSSIEICYPGIETKNIYSTEESGNEIRKKLNIDGDTFVWLMSGTIDENKNTLLFIDLLQKLLEKEYKVHFIWIGSVSDEKYFDKCTRKTKHHKLQKSITFTDKLTTDYYDYFNSCNGFVLTSRKESFSIVTVEALLLGKPVVCFDCGGTKEIISDDTGIIVENYDADQMTEAMIKVMTGDFKFDSTKAKTTAMKFDITSQVRLWQMAIKKYF